jgi:putative endonuclease
MATVYIIFSDSLNKFYIGYTTELVQSRIEKHNSLHYDNKFTAKGIPWKLFLQIECTSVSQALKIEKHIKLMKSSSYIRNLQKYPEMVSNLLLKYN